MVSLWNKIWPKNATGVDTSQFAKKDDLANLKSEVDKLDIDKFKKIGIDKLALVSTVLSQLSDLVKNDVAKKKIFLMLRSKILKIKYQVLLTQLRMLLLMLK